jgi:hypothetical protein
MKFCTLDLTRFVFKYSKTNSNSKNNDSKYIHLRNIKDVVLERDPGPNYLED